MSDSRCHSKRIAKRWQTDSREDKTRELPTNSPSTPTTTTSTREPADDGSMANLGQDTHALLRGIVDGTLDVAQQYLLACKILDNIELIA